MLTPAQNTTLKAAIAADGTLNTVPVNAAWAPTIVSAMNALASPDFYVWRTSITAGEIMAACVGSEVAGLTALKQSALTMLLIAAPLDASSPNIQADFAAIFSAGATLTALALLAKRKATRAEKILATGPGTGTIGSPATIAFEGVVSVDEAGLLR